MNYKKKGKIAVNSTENGKVVDTVYADSSIEALIVAIIRITEKYQKGCGEK